MDEGEYEEGINDGNNLEYDIVGKNKSELVALAVSLKTEPLITALSITGQNEGALPSETWKVLFDIIQDENNIKKLRVYGSYFQMECAQLFVTLLSQNSFELQELYLNGNCIEDEFISTFASGLKYNTNLKVLDLGSNIITKTGAKALADALVYNKTLVKFKLSWSMLGDEGALVLTQALRYHPSIKTLDIELNNISEYGIAKAMQFLKYNESIQQINCRQPRKPQRTLEELRSLLDYNDTLHYLLLHFLLNSDIIQLVLNENMRRQRIAPKKGVARRQDMYKWLYNTWSRIKDD